ncbi:TonB-dependent receptor domain-containing protein [Glacieibacterium sp.]|uniref:TonB-dependent receptor domain-containing protein n=1 Tax=Glacieibacterium sp. TaxID=2860237 RepID=UPI003B002787
MATTPPPGAQTAEAAVADEAPGADVVVTGTLIRNPNLVSSSPVSVTSSEEIDLKQSTTAERLIRDIPGVSPNVGTSVNNGNGGASFVDLRGLGANRNIVLLDGTRITPADLNGSVDLNNIPLALIDRVDLLTGGASTTYGADAVSGVVNFITKRDFAGVDLNVSNSLTERGDGYRIRVDATIGANFDDGRGNAVLSIGYQKADEVFFAGDRPLSNDTLDSFDGTASGASQTAVPARFSVPGLGNRNIDPTTGALLPVFATFNFNPYNIFSTPFKRFNIYGAAHYEASDGLEIYTQGLFSKNTVNTIIAPSGAFSTPVTIPLNNPFLPASARATFCANNDFDPNTPGIQAPVNCSATSTESFSTNLSRRLVEAGGRVSNYQTTLFNYRAGLRGSITDSFRYDVYGAYGESENTQTQQNYVSATRLQQALNASSTTACNDPTGGCVPVNVFGDGGTITPEAVNYLLVPAFSSDKTSLLQVHGVVNGDLFQLSSASQPVSIAVGAEYRKYKASVTADTLSQSPGELGGAGGGIIPVSGGYSVYEGFGEVIVPVIADAPLVRSLTVEAGVRYSAYKVDAVGSPEFNATTYKGGATWEPIDGLKFRGNYQRAVRAPNVGELFQPSQVGLTNLRNDPCQGAAVARTPAQVAGTAPLSNLQNICIAQGAPASQLGAIDPPSAGQINATFSGNPNNRPEKADTFTAGGVFQPSFLRNFSVSADFYQIKIRNALSQPSPGDLIGACFGNITASSASSAACNTIRRDPATGGLDGDPSTTPGLPSPTTNAGRYKTRGIDVTANFRTDLTEDLRLALSANANYVLNYKFQAGPGGLNRECAGYYSVNCLPGNGLVSGSGGSLLPKFSLNQRTTLSFGGVDLSLLWRHISPLKQEPFDANASNFGSNGPAFPAYRRIKAYDWFDLSSRFMVGERLEITLTVENLLDKDPPSVGSNIGQTSYNSGNTFPSTYDAIGRRFTAGARIKF